MKRIILIIMCFILLVGCTKKKVEVVPNSEITSKQWNTILESSKNTIVNVLYYTKEESIIEWLKKDYTKNIKIRYNIDLRFKYMPLAKIKNLMHDKDSSSDYDLIYISDDGFKYFKENDLLYEDILTKLPNYYTNLNENNYIINNDEGIKIEDAEVPIFKNQLVFINDEDIIYETPKTYDELLELAKKNPGKIAYPDPKTKTGLAFILSAIASKVEYTEINKLEPNKEAVYEIIKPGLDYLIELDKYLYKEGKEYLEEDKVDELFKNKELLFSLSLDYNHATEKITNLEFSKGCNTFVIEDGTTGFIDYLALPKNANNKSGAMVIMNDAISAETQGDIYADKYLNKIPVLDHLNMPSSELSYLKKAEVKYTSIKYNELYDYYIPEINNHLVKIIYELWSEYVE